MTGEERHIVVSYEPGTPNVRSMRPDQAHATEDASALRRAADVVDEWARREADGMTTPAPVTAETTDAGKGEGLTDAERAQVYDAARCLDCGVTAVDDEEPGLWLAVERIVAARVSAAATRAADERDRLQQQIRDREANGAEKRAESAEAALAGLVAKIDALADEWALVQTHAYQGHATRLRALLARTTP